MKELFSLTLSTKQKMDQMENFQTIIRFKKLEPNLNNHTSSIEGVADDSQGNTTTFLQNLSKSI